MAIVRTSLAQEVTWLVNKTASGYFPGSRRGHSPGIGVRRVLLFGNRSREADQPAIGLKAEATLASPSGDFMGTVAFRQAAAGVLIMAEVSDLPPGGHAFIIHETGACTPDFAAAGDHFNPAETEHGFVHPSWKRGGGEPAHGGDLPNIYAAADGSARADFFSQGITLDTNLLHTILDADGSAIIVHEFPDSYGDEESNTGRRLACGVIGGTQKSPGDLSWGWNGMVAATPTSSTTAKAVKAPAALLAALNGRGRDTASLS